ncbi:MAG: aminotransferase class I/II-fold pyridoxal phosphate-dependent enzyme [Geminicoccaceae bacterium]
MDIFDKYAQYAQRHRQLLSLGADPFAVRVDELRSATEADIDGRPTILAGTNNYLGLTYDPACIAAAEQALRHYGTGTTGSRIANGSYGMHTQLEAAFARFLGKTSAMVFSTGYQANLAMIAGLAGPRDVVLIDADSHASIYDACKLSGATIVRFRHNDPSDLDKRLRRLEGEGECKLVIVEGLYSMLGDTAPLPEFVEVKKRHGAWLLVDEAHSFGCFGAHGRGLAEVQGVEEDVDFVVGTFSKSLGAIGGFGASSHPGFDLLRLCARPYMFTASPSPASIASVHAALERIGTDPALRERLWANAQRLHAGFVGLGLKPCSPPSPVIAVPMPDELSAALAWNLLREHGVYVNLALPPGTPNSLCLLRSSVSAAHSFEQIDEIVARFGAVLGELAARQPALAAATV